MRLMMLVLTVALAIHASQATVPMLSEEGCARQLDTLGVYFDASRRLFIITIAADDSGAMVSLCPRSVSVERLKITRQTVKAVQDALAGRSFHPYAVNYTYTTWLDLKTGKMIVVTDAPNDVLDPLRRQFGNVLVFRPPQRALDINDVRDQRRFLRH